LCTKNPEGHTFKSIYQREIICNQHSLYRRRLRYASQKSTGTTQDDFKDAQEKASEALVITKRSGYVLQGADVNLFLAELALTLPSPEGEEKPENMPRPRYVSPPATARRIITRWRMKKQSECWRN
jgi:hypothetical protein